MRTLTAILVGGPKDGQAMRVPEINPPVILVPFHDIKHYTTYDPVTPDAFEQDYRIAAYNYQPWTIGREPLEEHSQLRFYVYAHEEVKNEIPGS